MGLLRFYRHVLWLAFRHSLDGAHLVAFVVLLIVSPAAALWPPLRVMLGLTEWQIAAVSLGLIIVLRLIMAPYWAYREVADVVPGGGFRGDMRINEAIDYIVNGSNAKLKQPDPPKIMEYGPGKGRRLVQTGVQHEDARSLLNTELISGKVRCWGRREILNSRPIQFELSAREIDRFSWNDIQLNFLTCMYYTESASQTANLPGRDRALDWTALMVSSAQIQQIWPRKSIVRRIIGRIRRQPQIRGFPTFNNND